MRNNMIDTVYDPSESSRQYDPMLDKSDGNSAGATQQMETDPNYQNSANQTEGQNDLLGDMQQQIDSVRAQIGDLFESVQDSDAVSSVRSSSTVQNVLQEVDSGEVKRWASLIGGGFLALYGLRRSFGSLTLLGIGTGLVYYAFTGRRPLSELLERRKKNASGLFQGALSGTPSITTKNIIVHADIGDVYGAWANFTNFPHFMQHIESVTMTGEKSSHWVMAGPLNTTLEWDAQTTRMEENKRIAWNSTEGDIKTSGQVTFNSLPDNQVEVTVMLKYVPPAGLAGEVVAELFGKPEEKLMTDLRNFKRYIEQRAEHA